MKILILFLTFFLPWQLQALDFRAISVDYEVSYGFIGEVGKAHATINIVDGTYKIRIEAQGVGIAKFLSRERKEVYESTGVLVDGKLLPDLFVKDKSWGEKVERKRYFFNHKQQTVYVIKTSVEGGKVSETRELLPYYAKDDILTLFFNLPNLIGIDYNPAKKTNLFAVGANRKDGALSVEVPKGSMKKEIKNLLKKDNHLLITILNQRLFASKNGELFLNINEDGICDRVILKDVVLYGDLLGKIKNVEITR